MRWIPKVDFDLSLSLSRSSSPSFFSIVSSEYWWAEIVLYWIQSSITTKLIQIVFNLECLSSNIHFYTYCVNVCVCVSLCIWRQQYGHFTMFTKLFIFNLFEFATMLILVALESMRVFTMDWSHSDVHTYHNMVIYNWYAVVMYIFFLKQLIYRFDCPLLITPLCYVIPSSQIVAQSLFNKNDPLTYSWHCWRSSVACKTHGNIHTKFVCVCVCVFFHIWKINRNGFFFTVDSNLSKRPKWAANHYVHSLFKVIRQFT